MLELGQRGRGPVELHAGKPMQTDELDQRPDLRLGAAEQYGAPVGTEPARQHRQVEHQRRVGEGKLAEVDDHVGLGANRAGQRPPSTTLR